MSDSSVRNVTLPYPTPVERTKRILLFAIRRIAMGGTDDAHAANAMLGAFGNGYRRPLMMLRVLMAELARVSAQSIYVAPPCCRRMTDGEAAILLAVEDGRAHPEAARAVLARVTGTLDLLPAVSVAQALADSLDDLSRPLSL